MAIQRLYNYPFSKSSWHVERIVIYNDTTPDSSAGRVTSSDHERAHTGQGIHLFLAHADLDYNVARKTQYLKDDHVIVHVVKVIYT